MTHNTIRYFLFGLLVILGLTTQGSKPQPTSYLFAESQGYWGSEDSPFTVRFAMTAEERRRCGLWIAPASVKHLGGREAADVIDLNIFGALDGLRRTNPAHHGVILGVLDEVLLHPVVGVVSIKGQEIDYSPILLTSIPPQRRLRFTIDDTRYVAMITLTGACELGRLQ